MKITETTEITPIKRTFNIELSENELKLLCAIVGDIGEEQFISMVETDRLSYDFCPEYEPRFTHKVYDLITNILNS